jgi:hypothetical protein
VVFKEWRTLGCTHISSEVYRRLEQRISQAHSRVPIHDAGCSMHGLGVVQRYLYVPFRLGWVAVFESMLLALFLYTTCLVWPKSMLLFPLYIFVNAMTIVR